MLQLIGIKKDYKTVGQTVRALKGIDLRFRKNEFVSILGASGCGKTTMLNIIGGLDHYTSGDLIINGKSTKKYKDRDWDVYRNHRIGFVFQSYNLIPHQTVLGNVEIALTIAGISKAERRARAEEALKKVGLEKEMRKRPNQLSGGQMQRVAIARALVNNPEILLADEPTGALDSETSVQIMDLIREIAGERLVIMVTHNPELAEQYSSRIVRLHDGLVVSDSNPYDGKEEQKEAPMSAASLSLSKQERNQAYVEAVEEKLVERAQTGESVTNAELEQAVLSAEQKAIEKKIEKKKAKAKKERSSMSFRTSLGLSARNLAMKKGRTVITSIAGSIGIISVCLVLALSNGFSGYISKTQEDMLSSNPLKISESTVDVGAIMSGMTSASDMPDLEQIGDNVYVNSFLTNMAQGMTVKNDLSEAYQKYVLEDMDKSLYEAISTSTGATMDYSLYTEVEVSNASGAAEKSVMSLSELKADYTRKLTTLKDEKYQSLAYLVDYLGDVYGKMPGTGKKDLDNGKFGQYVRSQYDIVKGEYPTSKNQAVLVIGDNNDMTDLSLARLGLLSEKEFLSLFPEAGKTEKAKGLMIDFDKIIGKKFFLNQNDSIYTPSTGTEYIYDYAGKRAALNTGEGTGEEVVISGILRLKEGMNYGCLGTSGLFMTEQLVDEFVEANMTSALAKSVRENRKMTKEYLRITQEITELVTSKAIFDMTPVEIETECKKLEDFVDANKPLFKRATKNLEANYTQYSTTTQSGSGSGGSGEPVDPNVAYLMGKLAILTAKLEGDWFLYEDSAVRLVGGTQAINNILIYTDSFTHKQEILNYLDAWNDTHATAEQVKYTDAIGMMMEMVEMMLNAITYVLVAFTAISLVVSSVMIGIITYVSVVERVKEIGVLRSLGARKKDIKNLFNAETFIIGLSSGLFGVAVTYLLSIGINALLGSLTGIATLASLPVTSATIMVVISIALTLISGLIPAKAAAKKDPVVALRTE